MKFLIDEDVPVKLLKFLAASGHDAVRATPATADLEIAKRAKKDGRILITLDKDFANTVIFPTTEFNIVQIRIHPPYADAITEAFQKFLSTVPPENIKGLMILEKEGHIRLF